MSALLKDRGFDVTDVSSVSDALKLISSETYDVPLSDLHMPGAGGGLTVVSAMRHANPRAITILFKCFSGDGRRRVGHLVTGRSDHGEAHGCHGAGCGHQAKIG